MSHRSGGGSSSIEHCFLKMKQKDFILWPFPPHYPVMQSFSGQVCIFSFRHAACSSFGFFFLQQTVSVKDAGLDIILYNPLMSHASYLDTCAPHTCFVFFQPPLSSTSSFLFFISSEGDLSGHVQRTSSEFTSLCSCHAQSNHRV